MFLVDALYKYSHPEYATYLYLMAPISLAILNPISFVLMEIGNRQRLENALSINDSQEQEQRPSNHTQKFKVVISVVKNIFFNPIIFMTILGILGNFIFGHKVPNYLGGILEVNRDIFVCFVLIILV